MSFISLPFMLFFPLVVIAYWLLPVAWRNAMLLVASYYFYMCWEPIYALLILFTSVTTWWAALHLHPEGSHRKVWLVGCLAVNLAILFTFKYYNFAISSLGMLLHSCGVLVAMPHLSFLLPVGISFYTFQSIGYLVDVWRGHTSAERSLFTYSLFIAFFPQLVAGPIERSRTFLPQFKEQHKFSYEQLRSGLMLMLWGYMLKVGLADRCALYVDAVYNNLPMHNGGSYLLASCLFSLQIYGDFCGYTLIAIGVARMMGFRMMQNFRQPFFAVSISDFWRRWHISLSSWFRDYVYIPLGGSRGSLGFTCRNVMLTMLLSGLWHGAAWTFVVWGAAHGVLQCLERMCRLHRLPEGDTSLHLCRRLLTFILVTLCFVLFRASSLSEASDVLRGIFLHPGMPFRQMGHFLVIAVVLLCVLVHDIMRERGLSLSSLCSGWRLTALRYLYVVGIVCFMLLFGVLDGNQFIYFQF